MTEAQQPRRELHPMRCTTCSNQEINPNDDRFCKVTGEEISFLESELFEIYGCASHNPRPHPQAPETDLLKEIRKLHAAAHKEMCKEDADSEHIAFYKGSWLAYNNVAGLVEHLEPAIARTATLAENKRVLEKMINILAAHTIQSDDFSKDGIKSGWILVGGYEPIIEDIESLRTQSTTAEKGEEQR
jgi:hypothetical protein